MDTRRVLKWVIPVDDRDHPIGSGPVVLVAVQHAAGWVDAPTGCVTVWTEETPDTQPQIRSARVYGTGQPVPADDEHLGSCIAGPLVWHVFASTRPAARLQEVSSRA